MSPWEKGTDGSQLVAAEVSQSKYNVFTLGFPNGHIEIGRNWEP